MLAASLLLARTSRNDAPASRQLTAPYGHNQPPDHAGHTRAEVKASLGPRGAAHLQFANPETRGRPASSLETRASTGNYGWKLRVILETSLSGNNNNKRASSDDHVHAA